MLKAERREKKVERAKARMTSLAAHIKRSRPRARVAQINVRRKR